MQRHPLNLKPGVTVFPGERSPCKMTYLFILRYVRVQIGSTPKLDSEYRFRFGKCCWRTKAFVRFWTGEFESFYNPVSGFDIDGAWIDMNEPSSVRRQMVDAARA